MKKSKKLILPWDGKSYQSTDISPEELIKLGAESTIYIRKIQYDDLNYGLVLYSASGILMGFGVKMNNINNTKSGLHIMHLQ